MLVGHTHEDIDAVFRRIYEMLKKKGGCLNPYKFKQMLKKAIPGVRLHKDNDAWSTVHSFLEYVHDFIAFFADCIYEDLDGFNTARSFIIRERDDGGE
eukprot:4633846-Pleurochrysis_carterae.AAC.1